MKSLFGLTTFLLMSAVSAMAADLPLPAKLPAAPAFNWTGFYVGGNAGGVLGSERVSQTLTAPAFFAVDTAAVSSAASPTFQPGNATAGAQAGYNYNMAIGSSAAK